MLAGALVSGVLAGLLALALRRRLGVLGAGALAALLWSVVVIGLVTLLPAQGAPGWVSAETRLDVCSTDIGGPAPDGFWIFSGGQRLLNTVIFLPSGVLAAVVAGRRPRLLPLTVPLAWALLAGYAVAIELTQLGLARLDRACDVTDMIDNATGAALGVGVGLVLLPVLRPWRGRRPPPG